MLLGADAWLLPGAVFMLGGLVLLTLWPADNLLFAAI